MPVTLNSSIIIGVRKDAIRTSLRILKALEQRIGQYLFRVGLPIDEAERFFLMEESELEVLDYNNFYYHMKRENYYVDSGDPDLTETDPFDDKVLQYFIKNITKTELFNCLIPFEDLKLISRIAGDKNVKQDKPIQLDGSAIILLKCSLYY